MSRYSDTNTKCPPNISPPEYKPPRKCLKTSISPGLTFGILRYSNFSNTQIMPSKPNRADFLRFNSNIEHNLHSTLKWNMNFPLLNDITMSPFFL